MVEEPVVFPLFFADDFSIVSNSSVKLMLRTLSVVISFTSPAPYSITSAKTEYFSGSWPKNLSNCSLVSTAALPDLFVLHIDHGLRKVFEPLKAFMCRALWLWPHLLGVFYRTPSKESSLNRVSLIPGAAAPICRNPWNRIVSFRKNSAWQGSSPRVYEPNHEVLLSTPSPLVRFRQNHLNLWETF